MEINFTFDSLKEKELFYNALRIEPKRGQQIIPIYKKKILNDLILGKNNVSLEVKVGKYELNEREKEKIILSEKRILLKTRAFYFDLKDKGYSFSPSLEENNFAVIDRNHLEKSVLVHCRPVSKENDYNFLMKIFY
jgi:hypothetical protein